MRHDIRETVAGGKTVMAAALLGLCIGSARAQSNPKVSLPKPDAQGWIKIFRGDNTSDFSLYTGNGSPAQEASKAPFGGPFVVQGGDTIRTTGAPNGQLIFKQDLSHYIMEVDLRWPNNLGNTGVMTKIQWNDAGQGGGLPRAIECQGDPSQGIGQIWALGTIEGKMGGTWITVRAKLANHPFGGGVTAAQADSTQPEIEYGGVGAPSNNLIIGFPGWQKPRPAALDNKGWVTIRVESHGKDTTRHFVDGIKVMQYRNPRIAPRDKGSEVVKYLTEGMLSVQSEGTPVWYRNWRIKLLPEDPLYASLYTTRLGEGSRALRRASEAYRLGFDGSTLTLLAKGHPILDLKGRITGRPATKVLLKP
ncbi:MAG: DUF1080 domain-containing protein [Fibrobacteria bacterium]